ncbi:hypothetical protein BDN72DRAFT_845360 [Pluteus cervinus]|uniref:Uncharacterized protein n=1 Tax=Pluteus cervinus TaxID=181527 RepID=A0ACD3AK16_9AGAR|nr:hypothetical protein BDN72DRAFT_845360 [Pluteus cervinus]
MRVQRSAATTATTFTLSSPPPGPLAPGFQGSYLADSVDFKKLYVFDRKHADLGQSRMDGNTILIHGYKVDDPMLSVQPHTQLRTVGGAV